MDDLMDGLWDDAGGMDDMIDGLVDDVIDSVIEGMVDDLYNYDPGYRRTVMVVDDEEMNRTMLGNILSQDYEVIYAVDGRDALYQIGLHKERLSLILLDLMMPNLDGYGVLKAMRANSDFRPIPVIVLTADKDAEVRSLQLGAVDFLSKPYDLPEVILARVRRSIELAEDTNIIKATENDALTGLYTREFFFEYGHRFDYRYPAAETDAIVLNFNRFHMINELYGRHFGDQVLFRIADGIRDVLMEREGLACRYDADTFYMYIEHCEDYDALMDRIYSELADILQVPEVRLRMGVFSDTYRQESFESRFDKALQACNSLRGKRVSTYAIYNNDMHEHELFWARLLEDFDTAIENKQFKVLYQPKYDITGEVPVISSAEALISWVHPEFGRVSPGEFIPLFEENGLIQRLDHYVWSEAAAQVRQWKDVFGVTVPVSVNVSRVDIYDPHIEEFITGLVERNGLETSEYHLEVTESAYTDNSQQIIEVVDRFRAKGFIVEMDDFGSGYSSLNMLTLMPVDALKLDMIFVRNLTAESKEMRMVKLVIDIAEFLGVPVIAEGVENEEQYRLLKEAGCQIVQGYYFSRPILPEELGRLAAKEQGVELDEPRILVDMDDLLQ
ncbi:MAG: EAL domain-containing protein [Lachnospiraceae bacterium]|nr:EAL domain-containing protein [Lachnospiraceae bacterium]